MSRHLPLNLGESLPQGLQQKFDAAISQIRLNKGAVLALSAGVDSSLVALLAYKPLGDHAIAATGVSESPLPHELEIPKETGKATEIKPLGQPTEELQNPAYTSSCAGRF